MDNSGRKTSPLNGLVKMSEIELVLCADRQQFQSTTFQLVSGENREGSRWAVFRGQTHALGLTKNKGFSPCEN